MRCVQLDIWKSNAMKQIVVQQNNTQQKNNNKKAKHEKEVTMNTEQCQEEADCADFKRKRAGGLQQKMTSKLSYQDRCFSAMANYFICSSAHPQFRTFRDESHLKIMNTVAGVKYFKTLTITHLKMHLNAELDAFKKAAKKQ